MDAVSAGLTIFRHHLIGFCLELVFSLLIKKKNEKLSDFKV